MRGEQLMRELGAWGEVVVGEGEIVAEVEAEGEGEAARARKSE